VYVAVAAVAPFAEADPAFPATEDCRAFLKELEALPRYGDEMKGGELHREARAHSDGMEYSDAIEVYKTILKKYEGTKIAAVAQEEAKDLISKGMVGYKKVCPECQKANRACARHHEEADL
jgi:triphosphoribosyl-dephospho-CoA synthetase